MSENTVYLITGANRGIGLHLAATLLARPNTTVVATARSLPVPAWDPSALPPPGAGSRLVPVRLDEADLPAGDSSATLAERLRGAGAGGVDRVDVVVANAAAGSSTEDVLGTTPEDMLRDFEVNAVGPARLLQALWRGGLLGDGQGRRFVLITSSMGSIANLERESLPAISYGMSKAAANWWAKKVSIEFKDKGLLVGIIHPGWVKTRMGQTLADAIGFPEPPLTLEQSVTGVLEQIDNLSPETSGKYLTWDGQQLPW